MPPILLQLPQPCAASWAAMTPTGPGRHCAACAQTVVDFTTYTDAELAAYLGRPGKLPCGRFRESQLGRVLHPAAGPVAGWRRWLGAAAALLGLSTLAAPARAQSRPAHPAALPAQAQPGQLLGRPAVPKVAPTQPVRPALVPSERVLGGAPVAVPPRGKPKK